MFSFSIVLNGSNNPSITLSFLFWMVQTTHQKLLAFCFKQTYNQKQRYDSILTLIKCKEKKSIAS